MGKVMSAYEYTKLVEGIKACFESHPSPVVICSSDRRLDEDHVPLFSE